MAAGIALAVLSGHHAIPSAAADASGHGTLGCAGLEALWESAGGSPRAAFTAAEIAMAESGGRQYASLVNANGTTDRGYWQINSSHGSLSTLSALRQCPRRGRDQRQRRRLESLGDMADRRLRRQVLTAGAP